MSNQLNNAVTELCSSFDEFRERNDGQIDAIVNRLNFIEANASRLIKGGDSINETVIDKEHHEAINAYMRHGEQGITSEIKNALTTQSDPDGGYFIPRDTNGKVAKKIFEVTPMRQLATVQPTKARSLEGLVDNDESAFGWVGEEEARPETDTPDVGAYDIPVHEMYACPKATTRLLEDSLDIEEWFANKLIKRFSRAENAAFVSGNGVKKPRGILTYTTVSTDDDTRAWGQLQYVASGAAGAFAVSDPADLLFDLVFKLKADYLQNASWMMNRTTLATIAKFKDGNGNYLLTMGNISERTPFFLLGYPVYLAEDMPAIAANSLSIAFGDFAEAYLIADRLGISVLRDPFTERGFVNFYTRKRVGGAVINSEAIKFMKFSAS